MSRYAGTVPSAPRRGPRWSHLHQSASANTDRRTIDSPGSPGSSSTHSTIREDKRRKMERCCTVSINDGYAKDEVLLNLDHFGGDIAPGTLMAIVPLKGDSKSTTAYGSINKHTHEHGDGTRAVSGNFGACDPLFDHTYIFVAKDMPKDMKARLPDAEVHIVKHIADAFLLKRGSHVLLRPVSYSRCPCQSR